MNVIQNAQKGKSRFQEGQFFPKLLPQKKAIKTTNKIDLIGYQAFSARKEHKAGHLADLVHLPLTDNFGHPLSVPMLMGHICILSDANNDYLSRQLKSHVLASLARQNKEVEAISFKKFQALPAFKRNASEIIYIVNLNIDQLDNARFAHIALSFPNFLITKLDGIRRACALNGIARSSFKNDDIIRMIGGNYTIRKYMIANLGSKELLAISGKYERICRLNYLI